MTPTSKQQSRGGYDSAVHGRADDHLNRWPFAKEIYGVATTGPREWSVRIGVYGEWGTGKTSVLNFIDTLARKDGHIVVRFNPWEYSDRDGMWRAFVVAVYREIEKILGQVTGGKAVAAKEWAQKISDWSGKIISGAVSVWNDKAGEAVEHGMDLLKRGLSFGRGDLEGLNAVLEDRRLVVLIDDLDRTNRELVPEMLYAIKEIMDVGGFVFVCAFDPVVVSRVLGDYHKGFDDGLKFLEKIIDYPRWLPVPKREALLNLARQDIEKHYSYVPVQSMEQVIGLLPSNPRALRQFIRLMALIKPQIKRHSPDELNWPIILVANVIKIRFPQLAIPLLEDRELWHKVHGVTLLERDDPEGKLKNLVSDHFAAVKKGSCVTLSEVDGQQLESLLMELARRLDAWAGVDEDKLLYQLRIAEAPAAVTSKEFDDFVAKWELRRNVDAVDSWIKNHSETVERSYQDVYGEVFDATIKARQKLLTRVVEVIAEDGMNPMLNKAKSLFAALECLVFELGRLDSPDKRLGEEQFEQVFKAMTYHIGMTFSQVYNDLRTKEKAFLLRLARNWLHDVTPLIIALKPLSDSFGIHRGNKLIEDLCVQLSNIVIPRYAKQILARFYEQEFIFHVFQGAGGRPEIGLILLDAKGPLWGGLREEVLKVLVDANKDFNVHQNAYEMLRWFDYKLEKEASFGDGQAIQVLLKDDVVRSAIWAAAISHPLNPQAIGYLRGLPDRLQKIGALVELPEWWKRTVEEFGPKVQESDAEGN